MKITTIFPEKYIRVECRNDNNTLRKLFNMSGEQPQLSERDGNRDNEEKRWKDAPSKAFIKINQTECASFFFNQDDRRNQISTYDEENAYPHKPATKQFKSCVKKSDWDDRESSQAVIFLTVSQIKTSIFSMGDNGLILGRQTSLYQELYLARDWSSRYQWTVN
jgi:hypothetical protein